MSYISRSQWYGDLVEDFLNSPKALLLRIDLYKSEAKRIERRFPEVHVSLGPEILMSSSDQRFSCIVRRKESAWVTHLCYLIKRA